MFKAESLLDYCFFGSMHIKETGTYRNVRFQKEDAWI
jgi:hypothetical protein